MPHMTLLVWLILFLTQPSSVICSQGSLPSTQALLAQVASDFVSASSSTGSATTSAGSTSPVTTVNNASILLSLYAEAAVMGLTTGGNLFPY